MNKESKNLYIIKLLTSAREFKVDMQGLRKEFSIPPDGFPNKEEIKKWSDKLIQNDKKINKFHKHIEKIIKKYRLPYNFYHAVKSYAYSNRITPLFLPSSGFAFSVNPKRGKNTAKWVGLKIYTRLTEKEIRDAIKGLKEMQECCLSPNLNKDIRVHKDINKAIEAEAEMEKKKRKDEKDFKSILKHTSEEIAIELFEDEKKAPMVRQMCRRLRKERKKLFGI